MNRSHEDSPQRTFALLGTGFLLAFVSAALLILWVRAEFEFTPSRGCAEEGWYVHLFFVGLGGLGLAGLVCIFVPKLQRIGAIFSIVCSGLVWASCVLMMVHVVPPWFWLGLSLIVMALPISLALILLMPRASATCQNSLVVSFSAAVLALILITIKPPWHLQVFANTRVLDGEVTFWNEHHQTDHATLLGRFRFDFMLWSLSGHPPHYYDYIREDRALIYRERQALVRLGYFQKRRFPLEDIPLHHVSREIQKIPSKDRRWIIIPNQTRTSVTIYACNADMPLIEAAFAQVKERQKAEPSPVHDRP